jgi:hypothetical protein
MRNELVRNSQDGRKEYPLPYAQWSAGLVRSESETINTNKDSIPEMKRRKGT